MKNISQIRDRVITGYAVNRDDIKLLLDTEEASLFDLFSAANAVRNHFKKNKIDLCSIINAKSGGCSEDCSYCAQSSKSSAHFEKYPLKSKDEVIEAAKDSKERGARRFCIVTGGRKPSGRELLSIGSMISEVKEAGLLPCATLGLLNREELLFLKEAGLHRYHHNLETSERFFPYMCSTHSYKEKLNTIYAVSEAGLSLCSAGIFGLGESWEDRLDMAFLLKETGADSIPINFLTPIEGTPMAGTAKLSPLEALKIISIFRFILPDREIRICGGRHLTLGPLNAFVFAAGADGLLTGNYLTTLGGPSEDDIELIEALGLTYKSD